MAAINARHFPEFATPARAAVAEGEELAAFHALVGSHARTAPGF